MSCVDIDTTFWNCERVVRSLGRKILGTEDIIVQLGWSANVLILFYINTDLIGTTHTHIYWIAITERDASPDRNIVINWRF